MGKEEEISMLVGRDGRVEMLVMGRVWGSINIFSIHYEILKEVIQILQKTLGVKFIKMNSNTSLPI